MWAHLQHPQQQKEQQLESTSAATPTTTTRSIERKLGEGTL